MGAQEIITLVVIGLLAGMLSGMLGIGGGIVIVPALVFFMGFTQHQAQGTSVATLLLPIGILAAYNYHQQKSIDYTYAIIIAGTFMLGGYVGSKIALNLDGALLKKAFGGLLLVVAVKMIFFSKS
ncbi:MAG: sulfite exporter TauE/SafE family protein [Salibacteraceae bacterium]